MDKTKAANEVRAIIENMQMVTSKEIEDLLHIKGSTVRDIIRKMRREGIMIGSISKKSGGGGYYKIRSYEDYLHTRQNLMNRILSMSKTVRLMDKSADRQFGKSEQLELAIG